VKKISIGILVIACVFCGGCASTPEDNGVHGRTREFFNLSEPEIVELKKKVENGEAQAAFRLSQYYDFTTHEYDKGIIWKRKAAEMNHVLAQYNLGYKLLENPKTKDEGIFWIKKAAENGDKDANKKLEEIAKDDASKASSVTPK